jgi:replication factor C small subunit
MLPLAEKYRPTRIADCILPVHIKQSFQDIVAKGEVPNMILAGGAGIGKTTVARAMCAEMGIDTLFVNASEDGGIDTLRTRIRNYASTVSLGGGLKVVILDEADYLNPQSTQPALRGFIEEFSSTCRFIMTCNFKNRIIEPLHSRCSVVDFKIPPKEKATLAGEFMVRVKDILAKESIECEEKILAQVILRHFPDFRKVLTTIQRHASSGSIGSDILSSADITMGSLIESMKKKDIAAIRKWAAENSDKEISAVYRSIYESLIAVLPPAALAQAIIIIAEYQDKATRVADQEINLTACCLVVASDCAFS